MTRIRYYLEAIKDPFPLFPLESVTFSIGELVSNAYSTIAEQSGLFGVGRRYYSVEQEHEAHTISLLTGGAFVLGQTVITRTAILALKIGGLVGQPSWLPRDRAEILQTAATFNIKSRLSDLAIIDAVANYFKHHHEWPDNWDLAQAKGVQRKTIKAAMLLGLSPNSEEDSLGFALGLLGVNESNMSVLGGIILNWRERLAQNLEESLHGHGIVVK